MSELSLRPDDEYFSNPSHQHQENPSSDLSGLHTTEDRSMVNRCQKHPFKQINNVCMSCKVGLCPKCVSSSAMDEHRGHDVMDIEDAFKDLKNTCDALVNKGLEANRLIQEKIEQSRKIQCVSRSLLAAHQTKNLTVFGLIDDLRALFDSESISSGITQSTTGGSRSVTDVMKDEISDSNTLHTSHAFSAIQSGTAELWNFCTVNKSGSALYSKLAALTMMTDVLRIKLYHNVSDGLDQNVFHLWNIIAYSEPCGSRLIMLGGVDLLLLCFETFKSNVNIVYYTLLALGNLLAMHCAFHERILTTRLVNMLTYVIQNFDMTHLQLPEKSCRILAYILSQKSVKWPQDCLSKDEMSLLVMKTCQQFRPDESLLEAYVSFRGVISLLSQQESKAAKYWAVWTLNRFTLLDADQYCPILVREGGVAVLRQQDNAHMHDYVKDMAKVILQRIEHAGLS